MKNEGFGVGIIIGLVSMYVALKYIPNDICSIQANRAQCYDKKQDVVYSLKLIGGSLENEVK